MPLVEDNESYAQSVAALLALEHFNTAIITTGTRVLEVTKASRFSIAILDLNLPNFEGTTFVAALKYRALRIQIIVHTGHSPMAMPLQRSILLPSSISKRVLILLN